MINDYALKYNKQKFLILFNKFYTTETSSKGLLEE